MSNIYIDIIWTYQYCFCHLHASGEAGDRQSGNRLMTHLLRDDAARIAALEHKLAARSDVEKAFFDDSWISYPMLILVASIWGWELKANVVNGEGWSSIAHLVVIAPLEIAVLVALTMGIRTLLWRARLSMLRRRNPDSEFIRSP